jgi:hypothetical protein
MLAKYTGDNMQNIASNSIIIDIACNIALKSCINTKIRYKLKNISIYILKLLHYISIVIFFLYTLYINIYNLIYRELLYIIIIHQLCYTVVPKSTAKS